MPTLHLFVAVLLLALLAKGMAIGQTSGAENPTGAPPSGRIEYTIDLENPSTQTCEITMTVRGWKGDTLDVHLPVWRPGRYEILDPAGTIRSIAATDGRGKQLPFEKTAKSSWRITTQGNSVIRVKYTLYANALNNRTRHIDDTHAFLSGSTVFLFVHELRNAPIELAVNAPEGWEVATGLERSTSVPNVFLAADYDTLADSPLEIGEHEVLTFEVENVPHQVVLWGEFPAAAVVTREQLVADFAKFTKVQHDLFGGFPYKRYVFLTHIGAGMGGGTEHLNSTIIQTKPENFTDKGRYRNFLGLACHELFHTWNVKQFRPDGLKPYDYLRENYTRLLWVAEGTTTYYDSLLLVRAGLMKPKAYFEALAENMRAEAHRPGRLVQSLEDSSFDAWIKFNKATPDSPNSTVSFYSKGEIVNFMLDMELRKRTVNKRSLDSLMKLLYERYPVAGPAYGTDDLKQLLAEIGKGSYDEFFAKNIAGTDELDVDSALTVAGLRLVRQKPPDITDEDSSASPIDTPFLGVTLKDTDGAAVVTAVETDGPAAKAGIMVDDQVLALNGRRLRAAELDSHLKGLGEDEEASLLLFRRQALRTIAIKPEMRAQGKWSIERLDDATDEQKLVYAAWLGQPWPSADADDKSSATAKTDSVKKADTAASQSPPARKPRF